MPIIAENDFQLRLAESLVRYLGGAPTSRALAESIRRELVTYGARAASAATPEVVAIAIARGLDEFVRGQLYGRAVAKGLVDPGTYGIAPPAIVPIQQPSSLLCWATSFTMLYQWWWRLDNMSLGISDTVGTVGANYSAMCASNAGLPWAGMETFAAAAGLESEPAASYTMDSWVSFLTNYGPIWISIHPNPASPTTGPTHVIILIGIETDGTPGGSRVFFVDPLTGTTVTQPFPTFQTNYENRVVRVGIPYPQIFHWPMRPRLTSCPATIYFGLDSAALDAAANGQINAIATEMNAQRWMWVSLAGHASPEGTERYNVGLSQRRAEAVRDALIARGVNGQQIRRVEGRGERELVSRGDAARYPLDRRVEVTCI